MNHIVIPEYLSSHFLKLIDRGTFILVTACERRRRTSHLDVAPIVHGVSSAGRWVSRYLTIHYLTLSILGYENFSSRPSLGVNRVSIKAITVSNDTQSRFSNSCENENARRNFILQSRRYVTGLILLSGCLKQF